MHVDALDGLSCDTFMTRSTDHLSIKPPNFNHDCTSLEPQQQRVLRDVQPMKTKRKMLQGNPHFEKIKPGKKVWLLIPGKQESRWKGPYMVKQLFHNGNVDIETEGRGCVLKVKKYLLKPFLRKFSVSESMTLKDPTT